jgi:hypothetical protein
MEPSLRIAKRSISDFGEKKISTLQLDSFTFSIAFPSRDPK